MFLYVYIRSSCIYNNIFYTQKQENISFICIHLITGLLRFHPLWCLRGRYHRHSGPNQASQKPWAFSLGFVISFSFPLSICSFLRPESLATFFLIFTEYRIYLSDVVIDVNAMDKAKRQTMFSKICNILIIGTVF